MARFIFFCVMALVGLQSSVYGYCGEGWESFGGSCYFISGMTETWHDAHSLCKAAGGYLVRINTKHENEYLKMRARSATSSLDIWIDGTDEDEEGRWVYGQGHAQIGFTDWNSDQPNNFDGIQHCIALHHQFDFKWNDDQCSKRYLFICEKQSAKKSC